MLDVLPEPPFLHHVYVSCLERSLILNSFNRKTFSVNSTLVMFGDLIRPAESITESSSSVVINSASRDRKVRHG